MNDDRQRDYEALECCISDGYTCVECPYADTKHMIGDEYELMPNGKTYDEFSCDEWLKLDLLDLINRQQAEIERLNKEVDRLAQCVLYHDGQISDAIKDFWSRIQGVAYQSEREWSHGEHPMLVELDDVKEIYEEMVGDAE